MLPREVTIKNEEIMLSPYACKSADAGEREAKEEPCPIRTDFQRDRDRIIHCNSFRRLKHKTQVFLIPKSDHFRTRLTHTLEVAQIARTIARALRLNEDLTEAVALGHDLGHTPFGHDGERTLNQLYGNFKHYEQSLRLVEVVERDGKGLNLTPQVKDGILCHTNKTAQTLEGVVVKLSDKIAYINHDIEDAIRAGVLREEDLPKEATDLLGHTKSQRITSLVTSIIENSADKPEVSYSPDIAKAHDLLRSFMFENVYYSAAATSEKDKACRVVEYLYGHYCKNPNEMPPLYTRLADEYGVERAVCDYISGMTDDFAVDQFRELFIPQPWT
ncbi:MAG: deoxyguanosinetriphosphate triphosphohydrolase [Oscillospiraceae bacterium]|nr:deoxyguanosinetriphosphate triphosphohydrolase [Oscillospiraceae bacterium]